MLLNLSEYDVDIAHYRPFQIFKFVLLQSICYIPLYYGIVPRFRKRYLDISIFL